MIKPNLHFVSSVSGSIYEITSDLIKILSKEFNVTKEWEGEILDEKQRDILLIHFYEHKLVENKCFDDFKLKILIQPIDGTSIKNKIIVGMNKFDLIICPAEASRNILINNGVTTKIIIIPNYFKSDIFEKQVATNIVNHLPLTDNKIIFYHESTLHPRKGIELLYEGFVKAFSDTTFADQVVLIIKDQPFSTLTFKRIEKIKRQTMLLQKQYKNPAKIIKFSADLTVDELKDLWAVTNIYVSLSKIEGFGIPMLRMFLYDKPIIALENENSGYNDYLNHSNAYLIPTIQHVAKDEFMYLYNDETQWAIPCINDVVKMFRGCLEEYLSGNYRSIRRSHIEDAFRIGIYDKLKENLEKYSFDNVVLQYIKVIKDAYSLKK